MARVTESLPTDLPASVFGRGLRATTAGLLLIVTIVAFEAMSVATAMPTVVRSLNGLALYAWPFSAFVVANLLGMVVAGEVSDRLGPGRPMIIGLLLFVVGLLISGTATTMAQLIAGRMVQGLGGGVLIVVMYVVIGVGYPAELHPRVFGLTGIGWVLPSLVGPVIAGSLAESGNWRLVFLGLIPLALVGTALLAPTLRRLPSTSPPSAGDEPTAGAAAAAAAGAAGVARTYRGGPAARWPYALLAGGGVIMLQFAGERRDLMAVPLGLVGVVAVALAVRILLPIGTARLRRGLPAVIAIRGLAAGAFFAVDALVPLTLSTVHGYSAVASGVPLTLGAVGWSGASWMQSRFRKVPRGRLVAFGMIAVATAAGMMAAVAVMPGSAWVAYPTWILGGLGMGLIMSSVGVLVLDFSTDVDRGRNSASLLISDSLLSAVTIGFGGVAVAAAETGRLGLPRAVGIVDLVMVVVALVGAIAAPRLRIRRAPRHRAPVPPKFRRLRSVFAVTGPSGTPAPALEGQSHAGQIL